MKRSLYTIVFLFITLQAFTQTLTKEEAMEDLTTLQKNLERFHPGFYRYTTVDSMAYYFKTSESRLVDGLTISDLYEEVAYLLSKVRCGHTRPSMPVQANDLFKDEHLFMPLSVKYLGERLFIDDLLTNEGGLKRGDEIMSINGLSILEITRKIFEHHSADGFIKTGKYRLTERNFRYYYQLYVASEVDRYVLEVKTGAGPKRTVSITGEDWANLEALNTLVEEEAVLNLEDRGDYSYMRISTFVGSYMKNAGLDYEQFLKESFAALREKGVKHLVLDLRGNGGGDDNYGALLVSYIADRYFGYFERIEVTEAYSGYGNITRRNGRNLMISHKGLDTWKPQNSRFRGKVYVLTDGDSFSTCADVATVLRHKSWATLVGEETGGGYDGNTSGNSQTLSLPNSNIQVNLPMWMYTTANLGHEFYGRGAIPHYPITPSMEQFLAGKDAVLEYVVGQLIK